MLMGCRSTHICHKGSMLCVGQFIPLMYITIYLFNHAILTIKIKARANCEAIKYSCCKNVFDMTKQNFKECHATL